MVDRIHRAQAVGVLHRVQVGEGTRLLEDPRQGETPASAPQLQVSHAHIIDAQAVQFGGEGQARHRRVAAVTGAEDAHPGRIGVALRDAPAHGVGEVILHLPAPLAVAAPLEGEAVAAAPAIIDLQHGVTAAREELHLLAPAPLVARTVRPAMGHEDHRQFPQLPARRHADVARDLEAIPRREADRAHFGHPRRIDLGPHLADHGHLLLARVVEVVGAGIPVASGQDHHHLAVAGRARDEVARAGQRAVEVALQFRHRRIEPAHLRVIVVERDPREVPGRIEDQAVDRGPRG